MQVFGVPTSDKFLRGDRRWEYVRWSDIIEKPDLTSGAEQERLITIIDSAAPLVAGDDLADNRYMVLDNAIQLIEWAATLKIAGSAAVRVMVYRNGIWSSIFPTPGTVSVPGSGTSFAISLLQRGDLLRYDVTSISGNASGLWLALRGKVEAV